MFSQIQLEDTQGVPDMLEDYLCSYQTKLEALSQKELKCYRSVLGKTKIYKGF